MKNKLKAYICYYNRLPFPVYILFFSRVVNRMGDFVNFFLTLYLTQKLGFSDKATGTLLMIIGIVKITGAMITGKLGDHIGPKKVMAGSLFLFAVLISVSGFFVHSVILIPILMAASFFNGAERPLNNTMLAELTTQEQRKKAYSLVYLGINLGVSIGPLIAGFLFNKYPEWIFWGDGLSSLLAFVLIVVFIPETGSPHERTREHDENLPDEEKSDTGSILSVLKRRPVLLTSSLLMIFSSFIYSQSHFSIPLFMKYFFEPENAPVYYGYLMTTNAVICLGFTTVIMVVTNRFKPLMMLTVSNIFITVGFGMIYFTNGLAMMLISTVIWTFGEVIHVTNYNVFVANNTPVSHRGRFNGFLQVINGTGYTISPFISGFIISCTGITNFWIFIFILGAALTAAFYQIYLWQQRIKNSQLMP